MPEAVGVIAGFDDVAVVGDAVEQGGGHLGIAEDLDPLGEGQIGSDDQAGALVELADEVEQELAAGLGEGEVAELVDDDEGL